MAGIFLRSAAQEEMTKGSSGCWGAWVVNLQKNPVQVAFYNMTPGEEDKEGWQRTSHYQITQTKMHWRPCDCVGGSKKNSKMDWNSDTLSEYCCMTESIKDMLINAGLPALLTKSGHGTWPLNGVDVAQAKRLLAAGIAKAKLKCTDRKGRRFRNELHTAAYDGDLETVRKYLQELEGDQQVMKEVLMYVDEENSTALHCAAFFTPDCDWMGKKMCNAQYIIRLLVEAAKACSCTRFGKRFLQKLLLAKNNLGFTALGLARHDFWDHTGMARELHNAHDDAFLETGQTHVSVAENGKVDPVEEWKLMNPGKKPSKATKMWVKYGPLLFDHVGYTPTDLR